MGMCFVPEGCGVLELNDLCLAQVDGYQVVLKVLLNGGKRDKERLHIPDRHTATQKESTANDETAQTLT